MRFCFCLSQDRIINLAVGGFTSLVVLVRARARLRVDAAILSRPLFIPNISPEYAWVMPGVVFEQEIWGCVSHDKR